MKWLYSTMTTTKEIVQCFDLSALMKNLLYFVFYILTVKKSLYKFCLTWQDI